jgi:cell wall-associated NlpC family hydrolase
MLLGSNRVHRRIPHLALPAAVVALVLTLSSGMLPAGAAPKDDLAAKREQAAALEAQIADRNEQIAVLDEQYNQARAKAADAAAKIETAQAQLVAATSRASAVQDELGARAAKLYMGAGTPNALHQFDASNLRALGARSKYGSAAAARDERLLDDLAVAREDLGIQQAALEQTRSRAAAEQASLDAARDGIEAAVAEQQHALAGMQSDIAALVDQIAREKAAAEEARARAAMEAQAARQRASSTATQSRAGLSAPSPSDTSTGSAPSNLPPPSGKAAIALATAQAQLGKPYVYAGAGPDVFDCSGLTMYAWGKAGVAMSHSATDQYLSFPHVPIDQLQPGDLVVFGSPIHHVGMYVGGGTMIEAPHTGAVVRYRSIYRRDIAGASRPG